MAMKSPAERLAALPVEERAKIIGALKNDEALALKYDWRGFWARPDQVEPTGNWIVWLILAGRGWG